MTQESDSLVVLVEELRLEKVKLLEQAENLKDVQQFQLKKTLKTLIGTFFYGLEKLIKEIAERDADHEMRIEDLEESVPADSVERSYYENVAILVAFCKSLKVEDPSFAEIVDFLAKRTLEILNGGEEVKEIGEDVEKE